MDDKWAALFWSNRNKKQEHPEEVDDEQLRFFYSALLLYWVRHKADLQAGLPKEEVSLANDCFWNGGKCQLMANRLCVGQLG